MSEPIHVLKGHGTENDFVLVPDPDGRLGELPVRQVRALCDRRAGLGADGVIRVVRTDATDDPAAVAARTEAEWFMDYRNADGSLSEMCGNGIRVLGRYLADHRGADPSAPLPVATRGGVRTLRFTGDQVTVDMGRAQVLAPTAVTVEGRTWQATHVDLGNPHAVAFVDDLDTVGPLLTPPGYDETTYPEGVNVELVVDRGPAHVAMRVHERGSGETRSCGTGACAAMVAAATRDGLGPGSGAGYGAGSGAGDGTIYRVDVPGGTLHVTWTPEDRMLLSGPAVIVAEGRWLG